MRTRRSTAAAIFAMALVAVPAARPAAALTTAEINSQIKDLKAALNVIGRDLNEAERRLTETDVDIRRHTRALREANERSAELREAISQHAAELYMMGSFGDAGMGSGETLDVYVDRMAYFEVMHRGERQLLEEATALRERSTIESAMLRSARTEAAKATRLLSSRQRELSSKLSELSRLQSFLDSARIGSSASRSSGRGMYCPVVGGNVVLNNFGDPRPGGPHQGDDIRANTGQWVRAVLPGTIVDTPYGSWWGIGIVLRDLTGTEWWYAHLSAENVTVGERVSAGELLGRVGCTGTCYGSHLHFEWHPGGGSARDPYSLLSNAC